MATYVNGIRVIPEGEPAEVTTTDRLIRWVNGRSRQQMYDSYTRLDFRRNLSDILGYELPLVMKKMELLDLLFNEIHRIRI